MNGDIAVVFGTRPEIIKLAPVIKALGDDAIPIFTGQHYDSTLTDDIFRSCHLSAASTRLTGVGGHDRARQLTTMLTELTDQFRRHRPGLVIVQGDTNSANAGAQAAHYLNIPVLHVEAGLRSFDRAMPEEINRLVISAVADVHCCATRHNADNLAQAGTPLSDIYVTGNTIVEATHAATPSLAHMSATHRRFALARDRYVLTTLHRPENVDDPARLQRCLTELGQLDIPVLFPAHPRTRSQIESAHLLVPPAIQITGPVDHQTFLALAVGARLLVSDSGGVQEEVTVLGKPLVIVRNSTERPETIDAGFAVLTQPHNIVDAATTMLRPGWPEYLKTLPSPFGDTTAATRIAHLARRKSARRRPTPDEGPSS